MTKIIRCNQARKVILDCLKQAGYKAKISKNDLDEQEYIELYIGEKLFFVTAYTDIEGGC